VYCIPLAKETASPFAPKNDEVKTDEQSKADSTASSKKKNEKTPAKTDDATKPKVTDVKIDLDGIMNRLISLPIDAANYFNINSIGDNVYYQRTKPGDAQSSLMIYKLKGKKEDNLGNLDGYEISADGKKMMVANHGNYSIIDVPQSKFTIDKNVDLSGMKLWVNKHDEWNEIFNECWRQMRDFFYDPTMQGVNWNAMKTKYGALVPYVNHRADLTYVIGEMIGELSIGHSYVGGGDEPKPERIPMGMLGAKLSKDASGYYKIDKILDGANWSNDLRSPLTEVGVNVNAGDFILAVNGAATNSMNDIYSSLVNTAGKQVELTVNSKASLAGSRKVIVIPIGNEKELYYYNWVQHNIRYVDSISGGKIGYLHIPNMGVEGLNEFIKHFYPQLNKKALIIDDRGNGGGFVSGLVAERLSKELVYYNMMRNTIGGTDPQMLLGPKVLLIDRYSASDGDIIAYRFKKYNIGKVIGVRTWGGVVGIRGSLPLMDGGYLMRPEFAPYNDKGWVIEGYGVDPDIVLDNDPAQEYLGTDAQLNKGVEELLEELKTQEQNVPAIPPFKDKSK
ncbi:MAG: PDZ domain-containing protein, partial [Chitinophagales bacterium]|nr:PDZ domain-containing protein [Chitinophagales bacterium]